MEVSGKGERTEELLRYYFLEVGYFVVRAAKFHYKEFDVTDVDLFLYSKTSPFSRQRTIVDIKRKKTPQAIERIFWTKGLQSVLGFENAIVATTDCRKDIVEFGNKNDVSILDGDFIKRMDERNKKMITQRITEEDLYALLKKESIGDLYGEWTKKIDNLKSILIGELNFNTCNKMLNTIREQIEYYVTSSASESSTRMLYIVLSFFLVTLDYSIKEISFKEEEQRTLDLNKYFRYGQNGFQRISEVKGYLEKITHTKGISTNEWKEVVSETIDQEFRTIKSEVLAEYFSKQLTISKLFELAIKAEQEAYNLILKKPSELSPELLSIIGVLCDFFSIQRVKII